MKSLHQFTEQSETAKNKAFVDFIYSRSATVFGPYATFIIKTPKAANGKFIQINLLAVEKDDHVYLSELTVLGDGSDFGKGAGTAMMKSITKEADKRGVRLRLRAEPLPVSVKQKDGSYKKEKSREFPLNKLIAFYKRFGFVQDNSYRTVMWREPK